MDIAEMLEKLDDQELAEQLKSVLAQNQQAGLDLAKAQRDLKLAKDQEIREKFPRAMAAYEKGYLNFGDDTSDTATLATLAAKEQELIDLGVAINTPAPAEPEVSEGPAVFGQPLGASGPAPSAGPSPESKLIEAMDSGRGRDVIRAIHAGHAEDKRGWGAYRPIVEQYQADAHPDSVR